MTVRNILIYPEDKKELRQTSESVHEVTPYVKKIIRDLKDTLKDNGEGIGLAAPQINIHKRVVIACVGTDKDGEWEAGPPRALVDPVILMEADEKKDFDGCLSFPGLYGETIRPHRLRVTGLDEDGNPFDETFDGFNAVVVHHEIDHLNGVLFIDRISSPEDLYRYKKDKNGELIKVPVGVKIKPLEIFGEKHVF
jgi:peptide deformylase